MWEKILAALITKYGNLGINNEILEGLAKQLALSVKEDTEINAAVVGAEPTLKAIQSFGDKRAGTSKTEAERLKAEKEAIELKLKELETKVPKEEKEEMPSYMKTVLDKIQSLETGLNNFNADRQSQTLTQKLTGILTEKNIPESFSKIALAGRQFKDEAEVTALAELVTTQFEAFKQDSVNTGFSFTAPPEQGNLPKSDTSDIAKLIETGTKEIIVEQSKK